MQWNTHIMIYAIKLWYTAPQLLWTQMECVSYHVPVIRRLNYTTRYEFNGDS